jgi:hypothetical protein
VKWGGDRVRVEEGGEVEGARGVGRVNEEGMRREEG